MRLAGSGVVWENRRPELLARHAWHPSLVALADGSMLCSFDIGQAPESHDYRTYLSRSDDGAASWSEPVPIPLPETPTRHWTCTLRLSRLADGTLVGFGARHWRDDPDAGLINHPGLGFTPMELVTLRSPDEGRSWSTATTLDPPLVGPAFEICHPVVELRDGRWLAPTSTWPGWDSDAANGMRAVALVSHDRGESWDEWLTVFDGWANGVVGWEQSVLELPGGALLATCWRLELESGSTLPTALLLAEDGRTFSAPQPTGVDGQTTKLAALADGRLLAVYRRDHVGGMWACLLERDGAGWRHGEELCVWSGGGTPSVAPSIGDELSALRCGYPSIAVGDDAALVVFWCREDCRGVIRWVRLEP